MGRVFTAEELRNKEVPNQQDFEFVLERLRTLLPSEQVIKSALVCGSVIRGDHTVRSDVDCVVVYAAAQERKVFSLLHHLAAIAGDHKVPLKFIPCDDAIHQTKMHHLGPSFVKHLRRSASRGGLIKGNPFNDLPQNRSEREELESYLRYKLYKLQAQWVNYPNDGDVPEVSLQQKMLEAPIHVARKVLARIETLDVDSKAEIHQKYLSVMPEKLGVRLTKLLLLDKEYSQEVVKQLNKFREVDYETMLDEIDEQIPNIIEFVRWNLEYVDQLKK